MKTGHKYLDYKSTVNIQNDVKKWEIIREIFGVLTVTVFYCFFFHTEFFTKKGFMGEIICYGTGLIMSFLCFMYGYAWRKVKNLRHQRNIAQGILLAKEFEKEEKDLEE